ncbi:MAG TPA: DUF2325 domain-containing protein [Syntrophaceae bacterium]|nr:DUF2325 domain-containing protein [Syntrophaceae bacterium]
MCIALIGGMDRLERHYIAEAERFGIDLKVFTKPKTEMPSKIKNVDVMLIFTNKVSHHAKKKAINIAKSKNIPVFMYHSCGICTLRGFFNCLEKRRAP